MSLQSHFRELRKRELLVVFLWAAGVVGTIAYSLSSGAIDLLVYRAGSHAWIHGAPLYARALPIHWTNLHLSLSFTYPPAAAVTFVPLAVIPWQAATVVLNLVGLLALTGACVLTTRRLYGPGRRTDIAGLAFAVVAMALGPGRDTAWAGQINLVLLGMVTADCLLPRTRYPRGLLLGLAAAIKLTPLIFVVYFLTRRQWREAATMVGTFLAAGLLGFLAAPSDSRTYWFTALKDADRIGAADDPNNQSLRGLLYRFGLTGTPEQGAWAVLAVAVLVLCWIAVRRLRHSGDDVAALILTGVAGVLISPMSWEHHWVWIISALPLMAVLVQRHRSVLVTGCTAVVLVTFLVGLPFQMKLEKGTGWPLWLIVVGNAYIWLGIAALLGYRALALPRDDVPGDDLGQADTVGAAGATGTTRARHD